MSVVKVVEIMASSPTGWEDAAQQAVAEASKSLHNIRSFYVKEHHAAVENGKIKEYRITGKLTFELDRKD
jgi:dodecin